MTKAISLTVALYGSDYMEWGLRSIRDSVDECWVLYTNQPSFGHGTQLPCPDTREMMYDCAVKGAGSKLRWFEGSWPGEGYHRDTIFQLVPDADVILVVDTDEIWQAGLAEDVIRHMERTDDRTLRIPVSHAWRSFNRWILNDGMHGEHAHAPKHTGMVRAPFDSDKRIFHFGYALRTELMFYKQHVHGHKPEWRWDWYDSKVLPNAQVDVHPVVIGAWNPEPADPFALGLPEWAREHPYASLEVIP